MNTRLRSVWRIGTNMLLLVLGLGVPAVIAFGQYPPAPPPLPGKTERFCTKKTSFNLPIQISPKDKAAVREVLLYVREPDGQWQPKDKAAPTQSEFHYHATQEGEYWFSVVTVDYQGRHNPNDVIHQSPDLIVVVDTTPPVVEISPFTLPGSQLGLRCLVKDNNPDYQKLHLTYQAEGQAWMPLEPAAGMPGVFRLPTGAVLNGTVRYMVEDQAGNKNAQEVSFKNSPEPSFKGQGGVAPGTLPPGVYPSPPVSPPPPPSNMVGNTSVYGKPGQDVMPVSTKYAPSSNPNPPFDNGYQTPGHSSSPQDSNPKPPSDPPAPFNTPNVNPLPQQKSYNSGGMPNRLLINTLQAAVDYRLDKVGPSGVSKVEVWMKGENASSWQRLAVDTSHKSPANIQLPHEGLFGLRLVVTNGNGFGGNPPQPHEMPTSWIEVDTTPPFAQLHPVGPVSNGDIFDLRWTATDKNLGTEPVTLYYATQRTGPWHQIAHGLPNSGQFSWHFPKDIGAQFYVRLEVVDDAGNVARTETNSPVQLDLSEPQASVVGVTGVAGKN